MNVPGRCLPLPPVGNRRRFSGGSPCALFVGWHRRGRHFLLPPVRSPAELSCLWCLSLLSRTRRWRGRRAGSRCACRRGSCRASSSFSPSARCERSALRGGLAAASVRPVGLRPSLAAQHLFPKSNFLQDRAGLSPPDVRERTHHPVGRLETGSSRARCRRAGLSSARPPGRWSLVPNPVGPGLGPDASGARSCRVQAPASPPGLWLWGSPGLCLVSLGSGSIPGGGHAVPAALAPRGRATSATGGCEQLRLCHPKRHRHLGELPRPRSQAR